MLTKRLIPVVLLRNGMVVQSKGFKRYQVLGNPTTIVSRLSNWYSDELIYIDISREQVYDLRRDDLNCVNRNNILDILEDISKKCFMPLTFGGGIRTIDDIYQRLKRGADKVSINRQAFIQPDLITDAARRFGSQCIVVSIDYKKDHSGKNIVFIDGGKHSTEVDPVNYAYKAQELGAGEILLNSIDCDGVGNGYDLDVLKQVLTKVNIPVITLGGVGNWQHLAEGLNTGASAVAAANIFSHTENSVYNAKKYLHDNNFLVREAKIEVVS